MKIQWLNKPLPAALLLILLWTGWRLAVLSRTGIPAPIVHDEFSYLLGADTFVHGRLANPPLPLAKFFESPHILVRPTYASKFPPGQAMFLALGQKVFGHPFYGVLIGNALMLFTTCVMLYAWVPPPWAIAASVMLSLWVWPGMYWTNSYWGGSVAASGGALVLLGIGIYRTKQTFSAGVIFAIGALLLFWTRPFEGGVFVLLVLIIFAGEIWRKRSASTLVAALLVFAVGGAWTCYYNRAITGNPLLSPYLEHERQYSVTPLFLFLPLRPEPNYSNPRLAAQFGRNGFAASIYEPTKPLWKRLANGPGRALEKVPLWPALLLLLVVPLARHEPVFRKMAIVAGVFFLMTGFETYHMGHYYAPIWAGLALMVAIWAERVWDLRIRRMPAGKVLVLLALASSGIDAVARPELKNLLLPLVRPSAGLVPGNPTKEHWQNRREALIERLGGLNRRQLVIVRYPSPDWRIIEEWVYNGADFDQQRVLFAHDFGPDQNRALLNYYSDRGAWLLTFDPGTGQEHIESYPSASSQRFISWRPDGTR